MCAITLGEGILLGVAAAGVGTSAYEVSNEAGLQSQSLGLAQNTASEQSYYNNLLQQLIANPSSVSSLPGYQFQLSQGSAAVAAGMGAQGFAGSGNEAAALTQFGQGLASSFYGQQTSLLASLSGVTAASSPASDVSAATGAETATSSTLSGLLNSLGFYGMMGYESGMFGGAAGTPNYSGSAADYNALGVGPTMVGGGGYTVNTPGYEP